MQEGNIEDDAGGMNVYALYVLKIPSSADLIWANLNIMKKC